jgi:hypothetical protein
MDVGGGERMSDAVGLSDDYAVLEAGGLRFYFGYEFTILKCSGDDDGSGEWCFIVHRLDTKPFTELFRIPQSKLGLRASSEPVEFLLEGIALWMNKNSEASE